MISTRLFLATLCALAASSIALAQQPPPLPPPPPPQAPQGQPPPPPQPDGLPPRRNDSDNDDGEENADVALSLVWASPAREPMATIRPFDDPVLGFGNDDLWNWPGAVRPAVDRVATADARRDSDIAVGGGPD